MLVTIKHTEHGDYIGGYLEKSNFEILLKQFPDLEIVTSGYSYQALAYDDSEEDAILLEVLQELEECPILNEEHLSNLEWEAYTEQFDPDCFASALTREFELSTTTEWRLREMDKDELMSLYEGGLPSGEYYLEQTGMCLYILYDAAAENLPRQKLADFIRRNR